MGKTLIISEFGANHNRDWETAKKGIDAAVAAKSDTVKFQTYSSDTMYASNTPDFAGYENINKLIKDIELPREWQKDLKSYCDDKGIEFMSTPFDEKAVEELYTLGVKRLKISGFEATDPRFVEVCASTGLPIIMSCGIGFDFKYWGKYSKIFEKYKNHVTLLHCNNAYPTPMKDVKLGTIAHLNQYVGVDSIGFSDHTMSTLTPALAVAAGAEVIEKHFTLDRNMKGPDHAFALEPHQLSEMVKLIREAEPSVGVKDGFTDSEKNFKPAMRSVVTKRALKAGELLTVNNITTKRPCFDHTAPAMDYYDIIGYPVESDIDADTPIDVKDIPLYYEPRDHVPGS